MAPLLLNSLHSPNSHTTSTASPLFLGIPMERSTDTKKRPRGGDSDDSLADSAESKLARVSSDPDEFLNILEDSEEAIQGIELDSFIRSFEEEIQQQQPLPPAAGSPQPELGYLYEASDDELGLPPAGGDGKVEAAAEDFAAPAGALELEADLGFGDEIPCYDSFELGLGGIGAAAAAAEENENENGFVALGGLFDFSDAPFWPESLSAL